MKNYFQNPILQDNQSIDQNHLKDFEILGLVLQIVEHDINATTEERGEVPTSHIEMVADENTRL